MRFEELSWPRPAAHLDRQDLVDQGGSPESLSRYISQSLSQTQRRAIWQPLRKDPGVQVDVEKLSVDAETIQRLAVLSRLETDYTKIIQTDVSVAIEKVAALARRHRRGQRLRCCVTRWHYFRWDKRGCCYAFRCCGWFDSICNGRRRNVGNKRRYSNHDDECKHVDSPIIPVVRSRPGGPL